MQNRSNQNRIESQRLQMPRKSTEKFRLEFTAQPPVTSVSELKPSEIDFEQIISELKENAYLPKDKMRQIIWTSSKLLQTLPNLISVKSPVMVVGDIHGQFYDLLNIFEQFGNVDSTSYLFMGDFVDRGQFCVEVLTLLLCMKIKYPQSIHLLRGNHESRVLTSTFNFRQECLNKYDQNIYSQFVDLFDKLPLGAIVDEKYFCVHAGISPELETMDKIQKLNRFKEPPERGGICDLLWSDPVEQVMQKWMPNKNRMCSYFYGVYQSKIFLDRNRLKLIIRGHEVQNEGFKYQKNSTGKPLTLTIFSAPNYCDTYRNKGSVLQIMQQKLNIFTFAEVEHPVVLPNYMNIIEWSMPFLAQEVTKIFKHLLKLERTKEKRIKSDKILQNQNIFKAEVLALARIELIQRVVSQKKLKNEEEVLRQNLKAICQLSTFEFIKIKEEDQGEKHPSPSIQVIGPKLHESFKKLSSIRLIEMEESIKDCETKDQYDEFDTETAGDAHLWKEIPTFRSL